MAIGIGKGGVAFPTSAPAQQTPTGRGIAPDLTPYLKKEDAAANYATKTELANKAVKSDVTKALDKKADKSQLDSFVKKTGDTSTGDQAVNAKLSAYSLYVGEPNKAGLKISSENGKVSLTPVSSDGTELDSKSISYDSANAIWDGINSQKQPSIGFDSSKVELTGGFADDFTQAINFSNHKIASPITITKQGNDAHHIVLMMSEEASRHVAGITLNGGLPAIWESHVLTIADKNYVAFLSPYPITENSITVGVLWG